MNVDSYVQFFFFSLFTIYFFVFLIFFTSISTSHGKKYNIINSYKIYKDPTYLQIVWEFK